MKQLGVDNATLATFWKSEGRVHLEANCPVWAGAITQRQSRALTRVQRKAVANQDTKTPLRSFPTPRTQEGARISGKNQFHALTDTKNRPSLF